MKTKNLSSNPEVTRSDPRIQIHEFTSSTLRATSSNSGFTSLNLRVTSSNPWVTSSNSKSSIII